MRRSEGPGVHILHKEGRGHNAVEEEQDREDGPESDANQRSAEKAAETCQGVDCQLGLWGRAALYPNSVVLISRAGKSVQP